MIPPVSFVPGLKVAAWADISDSEIVERVRAGETALYEILIRRYNQRLYRVARSILRNDVDAEDVMQEAYVRAYEHLSQFASEAKFSTWLTKIAIHEALARLRHSGRTADLDSMLDGNLQLTTQVTSRTPDPERQAYGEELRLVLERAIDELPEIYRLVFVLRTVEGLAVAETAACLDVGPEVVKTRLHRARSLLRKHLEQRAGVVNAEVFSFHLSRCDRVVGAVFQRLLHCSAS